jgi:hypothetical protein
VGSLDRRIRRRAARSLVIQSLGAVAFLATAVVLGIGGQLAGAIVFGLLALVPLGVAILWGRVLRRGSVAAAISRRH